MATTPIFLWRYPELPEQFRRQSILDSADDVDASLTLLNVNRLQALQRPWGSLMSTRAGGSNNQSVTATVGSRAFVPYGYKDGEGSLGGPVSAPTLAVEGLYHFLVTVNRGSPSGAITSYEITIDTASTTRIYRKFGTLVNDFALSFVYPITAGQAVRVGVLMTGTAGVTCTFTGRLQWARRASLA